MGESRMELLSWLNQLTDLNVQKVEQCGKGYPVALIFDSIYGDIPIKKIDFNANTEVKYLSNWKVVQTHMARHKIDKVVPIDRLVKCKMQDNLEFLQWCKKYWDQYFPGGEYDAHGRRGGQVPSNLNASLSRDVAPPIRTTTQNTTASRSASASTGPAARRAGVTSTSSVRSVPASRAPSSASATAAQTAALRSEVEDLNTTVAGLEKERDFYFNKLRDIEILIQTATESGDSGGAAASASASAADSELVKQIQEVLYSTEEGFELPENNGLEADVANMGVADDGHDDDDGNDDEVF